MLYGSELGHGFIHETLDTALLEGTGDAQVSPGSLRLNGSPKLQIF